MNLVEAPFVAERFRLERPLGAGGMAVVYAAFDMTADDRPVALKVQRHADAASTARFLREAEILASVDAPGIVAYIGHGQLEDGRVWLALEWLAGETLQQRLLRGALAPAEALSMGESIARSLAVLHARGVVHRDIKPENLFLRGGEPEAVCLLDLGVARLMDPDHRTTQHGMVVGTPSYMAPEQARAAHDLDHRADLYALGAVLFEALSGQQAWPGQNPLAVMVRLLVEPAPRLAHIRPTLGQRLDALVGRFMETPPARRPSTALEAADELAVAREALFRADAAETPPVPGLAPEASGNPDPMGSAEVLIRTFVLVGGALAHETLADAASDRWQARFDALLSENDADLAALADGSLLLTFVGEGVPTDRAARAARCALALAAHLPDAPLMVATGSMRVGRGAPAIGRVIDRAADALRATPAGSVRLDATTAGLLDARFAVTEPLAGDQGERLLLGEIEPLSRGRLVGGRLSPFVGRERETLLLDAWLRETSRTRKPRWVVLHGPAGQGKTRLRDEVLARWHSAHPDLSVLTGACPERGGYGAGLRDALIHALGGTPSDTSEHRNLRLHTWLTRVHPAHAAAIERSGPFLAELLGIGATVVASPLLKAARHAPDELAFAVARAFADALSGLLARGPVALVLDDAHWMDAGTEAILQHALTVLGEAPLLILTLRRGESHPPPGPANAAPATFDRADLPLTALSDAAADRLVSATLLRADAGIRERLVGRACGNPYFLEELIRAAAEGHVDALPETVLAMVQARLALRSETEKRVLRAASVFGLGFTQQGVAALLPDLPAYDLDLALTSLEAAELVDRLAPEWRFAQETIREAAYAMLTPEDRVFGHAAAAEHLVALEHSVRLPHSSWEVAEHLVSAEQPEAAAEFFVRAADLNLERNDLEGAARLAGRGLAACASDVRARHAVGSLHQILAHVAGWQGRRVELSHHVEEALSRLNEGGAHWFRAVSDWVTVQTHHDDPKSRARLDALVRAAQATRTPEARADAAMCICRVAIRVSEKGATDQTEALFRTAFEWAGDPDLPAPAGAVVQRTIAVRAWRRGDIPTAAQALRRALYELETYGFDRQGAGVRGNLGAACNELGRYEEALDLLDTTVREAARLGLVRVEAAAWHNLGHTLFRVGRLDEGEEAELTALSHFDAQGDQLMAGAARCYLARIHTHQGRPVQGESEARRAAKALDGTAVPLFVLAQAALAESLLVQGRPHAAILAAEAGEAAARGIEAIGEGEILFLVVFGEALDAAGRASEAADRFRLAHERVLSRSQALTDDLERRAFLEGVAENAQAITRFRELDPGA